MANGIFESEPEVEEEAEQLERVAPRGSAYARRAILSAAPFQQERYDPFPLAETEEEEVNSYPPEDLNALTLKTRAYLPEQPDEEPATIRNFANFLFGDEMAILGVKWDKDGFNFKAETAIDQWVDHPVLSTLALAGIGLPFVGAIRKSAKVGKLAEMGFTKYIDEPEKMKRILATGPKAGIMERATTTSLLKHKDDWTRLADEMLHTVDEDAAVLGENTLKYFDDQFAARVLQEPNPEMRLKMLGGRKALKQILIAEDKLNRMKTLSLAVESGNATAFERAQYAINKQFSNTYFHIGNQVTKQYVKNMNEFWDNAELDQLFKHSIEPEEQLTYVKYLHDRLDPNDFAKLSPEKQQYFARTRDRYWQHQDEALRTGFITQETYDKVGRAHVAALNKKTDLDAIAEVSGVTKIIEAGGRIRHYPKLTSPTLKLRKKSVDEVLESAAKGELILDVDDIHRTSIVKDEMLHVGYKLIRDIALKAGETPYNKYAIKASAFDGLSDIAKKNWVSLDDLPGDGVSVRVKRMVAKALGQTPESIDRLPYVHQNVIDELFDPDKGAMISAYNSANMLTLLTAMHKPAKTVFNLPSHFQNLASNFFYFMPMAGVNPFRAGVIEDLQRSHKILWEVAKDITAKEVNAASVLSSREILSGIAKKAKVNTIFKTKAGTQIDLLDELTDPRVRQILEEQAFENVEGFSSVAAFYEKLRKSGNDGIMSVATNKLAKLYIDSVGAANKVTEKTIKTPLLSRMSAAYLAEDMVPKLGAYIQYRKRGWSIDQAVKEVGRKFPQYKTVGKAIRGARRYAFPWITFQAETARIMANNLIDSPLASHMWMQAADVIQGVASGVGYAPQTPEELELAQESTPFWATKPSTVFMDPQQQGTVAGALTGGFAGGGIGVLKGGPLGAAIGAASGALIGAGIGSAGTSNEEDLRAWVLDFLPISAIMPQTDSPFVDAREARTGARAVQDVLRVSPFEPFSVMLPLMRLALGEDEFGNEIPVEGIKDAGAKAITQVFGMISPPWVQKYGLRVGTTNKGILGLDRVSTMTLAGVAGSFVGYGITRSPAGAAGGALFGGLALGSQVDTSRFEEDLGLRTNPKTGERGNPVYDVLFNSTTALGKSWKATPGQKAFNEKLREDNIKTYRSVIRKKMTDAAINGNELQLNELIQDYFITYIQQYDDPRVAQSKFTASMDDLIPALRRHPQYKRFSEEELRRKLQEASAFAAKHRGEFMDRHVNELRQEIIRRQAAKHSSTDAIGFDLDLNFNVDVDLSTNELLRL